MSTTHRIKISSFAYVPDSLTIEVGDEVIWENLDGAHHTATRTDHPTFDTGSLGENEESAPVRFDTASAPEGFGYICSPHPFMQGVVIVMEP